jgi:hypothetical protein
MKKKISKRKRKKPVQDLDVQNNHFFELGVEELSAAS